MVPRLISYNYPDPYAQAGVWEDAPQLLSIFNMNVQLLATQLPIRNDWRFQQTAITTCIPLLMAFLVLIFFQSLLTVPPSPRSRTIAIPYPHCAGRTCGKSA